MPRGAIRFVLPPTPGGVREDVNIAAVPEGSFLAASNFLTRQGLGRPRPGYSQIGDTLTAADRILGFGFRGAPTTSSNMVVHTATAGYSWDGSSFTDITGTWSGSEPDEAVRMVSYSKSDGTLLLLRVNPVNKVGKWTGSGSFSVISASVKAKDQMVLSSRVVLVNTTDTENHPFRVQWSDFDDPDTWPTGTANVAELSETPDELVGCKAFGPNSGAIYKEDSVWLAVAQAARVPFQFQLISQTPGPVSPASIVAYRGKHYWLAKDGVVYSFDGTSIQAVASGLITTFRETFEWNRRAQTHGWALALQEPEIWWCYPDVDSSDPTRGVCLNLVTNAVTSHVFTDALTASSEWIAQADVTWNTLTGTWDTIGSLYPTWDSMGSQSRPTALVGDTVGVVSQFGNAATDNGDAFAWSYTFPWRALAGLGKRFQLDQVKTYWKKESASLPVTVSVITTDTLGEEENAVEKIYDIEQDTDHGLTFPDMAGQWVKVTESADSATTTLAMRGVLVTAWPRGLV